ncbi:MAG TPA: response regulator [Candidatus Eisenbacteria bacterium]|nr:response regulator [Candidatus Eisenbacteria bacterium]
MAKILVADDNSNIQKMVGLALKDQGIDVVAVGNGEAAVRKISDVRPDLVLADVFMPVRNGYEVCRYVKEDSSLSHIPVILLVGAFDPLDEQEAQRVGADGVLKKPFVPPDPLISMVKSALARAGVSIGNEPAPAEKAPEPARAPSAKDFLTPGVSSKLAALSGAPIPEAEAEPLEEFPAPPQAVKIAADSQPVAFGSLLETPGAEDDMAFVAKPIEELEQARNWGNGEETDEVEEEEEEEEKGSRGGWRPGGLDEIDEPAVPSGGGKAKDWREEAFHGNSPASISAGRGWSPVRGTQLAEVAEAPSVGVSTLESKPGEVAAPFATDAWAAALANTVEGQITGASEATAEVSQAAAEVAAPKEETKAAESVSPAASAPQVAETGNWATPSESPWELEAKKASLLAATWDAPTAEPQTTAQPSVAEAEKFLQEEPAGAVEAQANETISQFVDANAATVAAEVAQEPAEQVAEAPAAEAVAQESAEPTVAEAPAEFTASESVFGEVMTGSIYAAEAPLDVNATQEVQAYEEGESAYSSAPLEEAAEPGKAAEPEKIEQPAMAAPAAEKEAAQAANAQQTDMDALVARVLAKMSPEVLQKVTQEILKPVIEAIIKDELDAKK